MRRAASSRVPGYEGAGLECVVLQGMRQWARTIKRDVVALGIAARDPRVPWYAKATAGAVAAYALSPIDLIPDFIPVLGYLDDLLIVPLGIAATVWLIPPHLMAEFRAEAAMRQERPSSRVGLLIVIAVWLVMLLIAWAWARGRLTR